MSAVITINNLSKKYIIHHQQQERYTALRDVIATKFKNFGSKIFSSAHHLSSNENYEEFWALKNINLEVAQGYRLACKGSDRIHDGQGPTT